MTNCYIAVTTNRFKHQNLNFNLSKTFGVNQNQSINIQAENILNSKRESMYDYYGLETSTFSLYQPGISFSLGYSIKF